MINIAGVLFGKQQVQGKVSEVIGSTTGTDTAHQIQTMITNSRHQGNSAIMIIIGIAALLISATGLFMQLQKALNRMWESVLMQVYYICSSSEPRLSGSFSL